jgi:catechol 2,3-dioxygenase-like lactoylglutathione lyase family enzyme
MPRITTSHRTDKCLIPIDMLSHGTLTSMDLQKSRRFYEEVLGLEVIQVTTVSMLARKGTDHAYVIVESGNPSTMSMFDHNGIDVATREAVDHAYTVLTEIKEEYGLGRITKPLDQHGVYSFYFADGDGNWWEIMQSKPRGYAPFYDDPKWDLTGRTDIDPDMLLHAGDDEVTGTRRAKDE